MEERIHYNGNTWKLVLFNENGNIKWYINNIDFNKDIVVAVGYDSPKKVIKMVNLDKLTINN
ncbi:MAG: hypothetical protein M5T52_22970 [Ignavibacteriaceae bacterium]|nr:hypothetical protein [Ignavibacteriaceae bacterium]